MVKGRPNKNPRAQLRNVAVVPKAAPEAFFADNAPPTTQYHIANCCDTPSKINVKKDKTDQNGDT